MKNDTNPHKEDRVKPYVFIIIAGIASMVSSLGAPLVPGISKYYGIAPTLGQWSLTITLISATVSIPILAKISQFGNYKNVIFIALLATVLGCLLSAYAPTFTLFLMGRVLQGIGLGIVPSLMIAAQDSLVDSRETLSLLSIITSIGVGMGYPLSGMMATYVGIGPTFLCGGSIALLATAISTKLVNVEKKTKKKFDFHGSVLIIAMLSFLTLLLGALKVHFELKNIAIYFIGFCVSFFFWIRSETKSIDPIISIRVIKLPPSLIANLIALLSGGTMYMLITASMFCIQQSSFPGLSKTPLIAGFVLTPLSIATIVSRYINFSEGNNYVKSIIGSVFLSLSFVLFIFSCGSGIVFYFISMALCGYGVGLIYSAVPHIIKENLNKTDAAEAYGLNQLSRTVGFSIGSVISINIICSFFLNSTGEASEYSYMILGVVGAIISLILSALIIYSWNYNFKMKKF